MSLEGSTGGKLAPLSWVHDRHKELCHVLQAARFGEVRKCRMTHAHREHACEGQALKTH